jgi:hypothetical protein
MITGNIKKKIMFLGVSGSELRPVREADNLVLIYEPIKLRRENSARI